MHAGEFLIAWSVRLALLGYLIALVLRLTSGNRLRHPARGRIWWTAGALLMLAHVSAAFHYVHHWSHTTASLATARDTAAVTGLDWGGGLYLNYLFVLIWLADTGWWCRDPVLYQRRPAAIEWGVQGFLGFIVFNATVVFKAGPVRWAGIAASLLVLGLLVRNFRDGKRRRFSGSSEIPRTDLQPFDPPT